MVNKTKRKSVKLKKRKWCYAQIPSIYDITCDKCGGANITWSEYEHMIWCYKCKIDTKGTEGIFGGPIPLGACHMMGISFDRIDIKTGKIIKEEEYMNKGEKRGKRKT